MHTKLMIVILLASSLLSACGFHLRGQGEFVMPFQSLYVQSANDHTPFIGELKRALQAAGVQLADSPDKAQLTLHIVSEFMGKQILSLSAAGRVREYQLRFGVSFRAFDPMQQEWLPAAEIALLRNMSYDDTQILAKEQEEVLLYKNMVSDAVQQMLRRLKYARSRAEDGGQKPAPERLNPGTEDRLEPSLAPSPAIR